MPRKTRQIQITCIHEQSSIRIDNSSVIKAAGLRTVWCITHLICWHQKSMSTVTIVLAFPGFLTNAGLVLILHIGVRILQLVGFTHDGSSRQSEEEEEKESAAEISWPQTMHNAHDVGSPRTIFSCVLGGSTGRETVPPHLAPREIGPRDSSSLWPIFCRPPGARPCTCLVRHTTERRHSSRSRLLCCSPHLELIDAVTSLCPMPPTRGLSKRASSPVSQAPSHGYSKACCMR